MRTITLPGFVVVAVATLCGPTAARATDAWSTPFPGGAHLHRFGTGQDIHALVIDLCAAGVDVRTTAQSEKGRTVSSFASLAGVAAATNGDFFNGSFIPDGPAAHAGGVWGGSDHTYVAPVSFGPGFVDIPHHNNQAGLLPGTREAVSGHPTLLDDGATVGNPGDPLCTNRNPRTMLGITQDHTHLILAVADGRRPGAAGLTCDDEAAFMRELGAFDAVNLDGGGSTDMFIASEGGLQNHPSDGVERSVGDHLGIVASGSGPAPLCPTPPDYRAQFAAQSWPFASLPPVQIYEGDVVDGSMDLVNTGLAPWDANTKLAPIARDVASPLSAPSWLSPTRVSHPDAVAVAPGETGHFSLALAGNTAGEFDQFFGLVQEGVTWFADQGGPSDHLLEVRVTVLPRPRYRGRVVAVDIPAEVEAGRNALASVDVENIGTETWTDIVKLAPTPRDQPSPLAAASWLAPQRVTSADGAGDGAGVAPGDIGHFTFEIHGGDDLVHIEQTFTLVAEGVTWFADSGGPADDAVTAAVDVVEPGALVSVPSFHVAAPDARHGYTAAAAADDDDGGGNRLPPSTIAGCAASTGAASTGAASTGAASPLALLAVALACVCLRRRRPR